MDELWETLYAAETDLRYMINMNHARLSEETPFSETQVMAQQEARDSARHAIEERFKNEGMLMAYRDARELINDWDAGSVDSQIMRLSKKVSA